MADRYEHYRGYEIALYIRGRAQVRALIQEKNGLPVIAGGPLEYTVDEAVRKAKALIDEKLAARASD